MLFRSAFYHDSQPEPKEEPKEFGAVVIAASNCSEELLEWRLILWGGEEKWMTLMGDALCLVDWSDLINPSIVKGGEK